MNGSAPSDGLEGGALEIEGVSSSGPTPVTIYGRTYYLRGDGDARGVDPHGRQQRGDGGARGRAAHLAVDGKP